MEIALDSLVLFVAIIVPGITFRRFYFQGEFTKQFNSRSLTHGIIASILPGIVIQLSTLLIYDSLDVLKGEGLLNLYNSFNANSLPDTIFDYEVLIQLVVYLSILLGLATVSANFSYRLVRSLHLDKKTTLMRFNNHWSYYFKGEIKYWSEYRDIIKGQILAVKCDVLIRIENEEPRLYSGILKQHTIDKLTNELKNVYLTKVSLYKKQNVSVENSNLYSRKKPVPIPGDIMIFNANDIININLRFVTTPKKEVKLNFGLLIIAFYFVSFLSVVFSDNVFLTGSNLFKTVLIKFFAFIYVILIGGSLANFIDPKSSDKTKRKAVFQGIMIISIIFTIIYILFRLSFIRSLLDW